MPLINTSVPNLIQGVSQQPDATRFAGQCEEQENAISSVVDGLMKRPNTRHIAQLLTSAISEEAFIHFVNRSNKERYVIIGDATVVEVNNQPTNPTITTVYRAFNLTTGEEAEINGNTGGYTAGNDTYLETPNPKSDIRALTVADTTFLLNKTRSVSLNTQRTPELEKEALIYVSQGDYGRQYQVDGQINFSFTNTAGAYTPATLSIGSVEDFVYDTEYDTYNMRRNTYLRSVNTYTKHRIGTINFNPTTDGGAGYFAKPKILVTSNLGIIQQPEFDITMSTPNSDGLMSITAITLVDGGVFDGTGYRKTGGGRNNNTRKYYGETPPTLSISVVPVLSLDNVENGLELNSALVTSGAAVGGSNQYPQNASASVIAGMLAKGDYNNTGAGNRSITRALNATDAVNLDNFGDYFDVSRPDNGSVIYLSQKKDADGNPTWNGDFAISTTDGLSGLGLRAVYKSIDSIDKLPLFAKDGFKIKVIGDADENQDDYYVEFKTSSGKEFGEGAWVECAGFDQSLGFDPASMPVSIVNDDFNSFKIETMNFDLRQAGDEISNPNPSFVGKRIANMFFFKNRLGFLCGETVSMTESGFGSPSTTGRANYNLYRSTVTTLLDTAPIDVAVASTGVTDLQYAVGFQDNLILFATDNQFALKGGELLTAKSVSISPITNFSFNPAAKPLAQGAYIYFPFDRDRYVGVREFQVNSNTDVFDGVDITEHIPSYIPQSVICMTGSNSEQLLAVLSAEEDNCVYMYSYFFTGNKKVLSSWYKLKFGTTIRHIEFIGSSLFMITVAEDDDEAETRLVELPLSGKQRDRDYQDNELEYLTLLDDRVEAKIPVSGNLVMFRQEDDANGNPVYSGAESARPYLMDTTDTTADVVFVAEDGTEYDLAFINFSSGVQLYSSQTAPSTGDVYGWVGRKYTMKYKFSNQIFKAQSGNSTSPTAASAMQVRNCTVFFNGTNTFDAKVTPELRSEATETFSADDRPEAETRGAKKFAEGFFKFPVHGKAKNTDIVIENSTPYESKFTSAEFESFVHPRSQRYG